MRDCFQKCFEKCVCLWLLVDSLLKLQVYEFVATDSILKAQVCDCVATNRQYFEHCVCGFLIATWIKLVLHFTKFWICLLYLVVHLCWPSIQLPVAGLSWYRCGNLGVWDHSNYLMFICDAVPCRHWNKIMGKLLHRCFVMYMDLIGDL